MLTMLGSPLRCCDGTTRRETLKVGALSVNGESDRNAAFVIVKPVTTGDICATINECLGIDPSGSVRDNGGRPIPVAQDSRAILS
jgi:hypothetical protein